MNKTKDEKITIEKKEKKDNEIKKIEEETEEKNKKDKNRTGNKDIEIVKVNLLNDKDKKSNIYNSEDKLNIQIRYKRNNKKISE